MVSRKAKDRAIEFISEVLDKSRYTILSNDYQSILVEAPEQQLEILIPNFFENISSYSERAAEDVLNETMVVPIFYKDGTTAFVRMTEVQAARYEKSLKKYRSYEIHQMIRLSGIEREVLDESPLDMLQYYQPATALLKESLRSFELQDVVLDYTHLHPSDMARQRHGSSTISKTYKHPKEQLDETIRRNARFFGSPDSMVAVLKPYEPVPIQLQMQLFAD